MAVISLPLVLTFTTNGSDTHWMVLTFTTNGSVYTLPLVLTFTTNGSDTHWMVLNSLLMAVIHTAIGFDIHY